MGMGNRSFEYGVLAVMGVSGLGTWYFTDSVLWGALGFVAPPALGVLVMLINDADTHHQNGSGVTPSGRIRWFGDDSN